MEQKVLALLKGFKTTKERAEQIYNDFEKLDYALIEAYSNPGYGLTLIHSTIEARNRSKITETEGLETIFLSLFEDFSGISEATTCLKKQLISSPSAAKAILNQIIVESDTAIAFLERSVLPISPADADKLNRLRKELFGVCETIDESFEKNLMESVSEYESGHFLASALVSARLVNYVIDQISGQSIQDKMHYLEEKGFIKKSDRGISEEEEFIMKANKKARNVFSHEIKLFVNPSESLSLLGDCIRLIRITKPLLVVEKTKF